MDTVEVELTGLVRGEKTKTVVDKKWEKAVRLYSWYMDNSGFVRARVNNKLICLHQYILKLEERFDPFLYIDHVDRDRCNNTSANLRLCTRKENNNNTKLRSDNKSGFRGVSWDKNTKKWNVRIGLGAGKYKYVGQYVSKIQAAIAYNDALKARTDIREEFKQYNKI